MLVGRDRQRAAIDQAIAQGRCGRSAALAFSGPPGIGKTALLAYAAQRADGHDACCAPAASSPRRRFRSRRCSNCCARRCHSSATWQPPGRRPRAGVRPATRADAGPLRRRRGHARTARRLRGAAAAAAAARRHPVVRRPELGGAAIRTAQARRRPGRRDPRRARRLTARCSTAPRSRPSRSTVSARPRPACSAPICRKRRRSDWSLRPAATRSRCSSSPPDPEELALAPEGAPLLVSTRLSAAYLRRAAALDDDARKCTAARRDK